MTQFTYGLTKLLGHGHAFTEVVAVPRPAVASGFTYTVSGSYWEAVDSLTFRLVSDGNAANRQVTLTVNDGSGTPIAIFPSASVQAASLTYDYSFLPNLNNFNTVIGGVVTSPGYDGLLQPTFTLVVTVGSVQVGDQISRVRLGVQRFVTGRQGYLLGVVDDTDVAKVSDVRLAEQLA